MSGREGSPLPAARLHANHGARSDAPYLTRRDGAGRANGDNDSDLRGVRGGLSLGG
jgi:hypothetical protein